jgi:hypothetical protein
MRPNTLLHHWCYVQVDLDTAFFSERDSVHVHSDLIDAGIYICAPEVLVLFSDNFDFQHIQRDFIRGVLSEEELGNKLYMHVLQNEYAAHIANFRSYASVSMDIMSRYIILFSAFTCSHATCSSSALVQLCGVVFRNYCRSLAERAGKDSHDGAAVHTSDGGHSQAL